MAKLQREIEHAIREMGGDEGRSRLNARIFQVKDRYRETIEKVYRDKAGAFLKHTNSVYIIDKEGVKTLIVYVDESIFAAELNAQRELIKLMLLENFKEQVEEFEIHVSRREYRNRHPFADYKGENAASAPLTPSVKKELGAHEQAYIDNTVALVEDARLREAMRKAMAADFQQSD